MRGRLAAHLPSSYLVDSSGPRNDPRTDMKALLTCRRGRACKSEHAKLPLDDPSLGHIALDMAETPCANALYNQ